MTRQTKAVSNPTGSTSAVLLQEPIEPAISKDVAAPGLSREPIRHTRPMSRTAPVSSPDPTLARPIQFTKAIPSTAANSAPTRTESHPKKASSALLSTIKTLGELLDDLEQVRVANGNRIGAMERDHGESLPHLDVVQKQIKVAEHLAELELVRAWRKHPLAPWAKQFHGVGEKSVARLIAIIGDPGDRENVAKLWAYCGHGDPGRKRAKGMTQAELFKLGNPAAKKQVWLIATALLKTGNRDWYDEARSRYANRVHEKPCVRCGPSGHPAPVGSPWNDGHKHAAALRYVGKQFLKELWIAARQSPPEAQRRPAGGKESA